MNNRITTPGPVEQANLVKSLIGDPAALIREDVPSFATHVVFDRCVTTYNAFAGLDAYELPPVEFFYDDTYARDQHATPDVTLLR